MITRSEEERRLAGKGRRVGLAVLDILLFALLVAVLASLINLPFYTFWADDLPDWTLVYFSEAGMIVAALLAAAGVLYVRRLPFSRLGLTLRGHAGDWWKGLLLIVALYALGFGLSLLAHAVQVTGFALSVRGLALLLLFFLMVALFEEIALRGFVLGRLLDGGVNRWVALLLSSLLFSLIHLFNPGFTFLPFLNIWLAGVFMGASYIYTRNLCFPVALHWFWNWVQGAVLGYQVSGITIDYSLLQIRLSGQTLLNGGSFGFEGSLVCTLVLAVGTALILWKHRPEEGSLTL